MSSILLIYPQTTLMDRARAGVAPPFSLLAVVRLLPSSVDVKILDQRTDHKFWQDIERELSDNPLLVGISAIAGPQLKWALKVTEKIKELNPKAKVILGGPFSTVVGHIVSAQKSVDAVVAGEGEETLKELVESLGKSDDLSAIKGLWMKKDEQASYTGSRTLIALDSLPFVSYKLFETRHLYKTNGRLTAYFETSRGCPFGCTFCYHSIYKNPWRAASSQWTLNALEHLLTESPNIKHLLVVDDNYLHDRARAMAIAEGAIARGWDITYQVQARLDELANFTDDELKVLRAGGLVRFDIGVETVSERLWKVVGKAADRQFLLEQTERLSSMDFIIGANFMVGLPTETNKDVLLNAKTVIDMTALSSRAVVAPIYTYYPYPGSKLYQLALNQGLKPLESLDDLGSMSWRDAPSPWLSTEQKKLLKNLYFYSLFVDQKLLFFRKGIIIKMAIALLMPIARWRVKRLFFKFPIERWIFELLFGKDY